MQTKTLAEAQAFFTEMGTSGAVSIEAHSKLQELIAIVYPAWVPLTPPFAYSADENGNITLSELE